MPEPLVRRQIGKLLDHPLALCQQSVAPTSFLNRLGPPVQSVSLVRRNVICQSPEVQTPSSAFALIPLFRYNIRMNAPLKITKVGNSAGLILPKEVLAHLNAAIGENLTVVFTPRGIELSAADADFDQQMAAARDVMARRKRALRELAK